MSLVCDSESLSCAVHERTLVVRVLRHDVGGANGSLETPCRSFPLRRLSLPRPVTGVETELSGRPGMVRDQTLVVGQGDLLGPFSGTFRSSKGGVYKFVRLR